MVAMVKTHFETEENRQFYMSEWRETTLPRVIASNPIKSKLECLRMLFDKLQKVQQGLSAEYQTKYSLRDQVISACRGVEECNLALHKPATTFEGVCAELRSAIGTATRSRELAQFNTQGDHDYNDSYDHNGTNRTYKGRGKGYYGEHGRGYRHDYNQHRGDCERGANDGGDQKGPYQKKYYICKQPRYWSNKHTIEEH